MAMYGRFKAGFYVSFIDRLKLRFKNNKINIFMLCKFISILLYEYTVICKTFIINFCSISIINNI